MKKQQLSTIQLFDLNHTIADELLRSQVFPWDALTELHDFIIYIGSKLPEKDYHKAGPNIWVGEGADIARSVAVKGPAIIGKNAKIQNSACLSGNVIVGEGAVIGSCVELKDCILFNEAVVAHSGYVEDSIIGYQAQLGAGTVVTNETFIDGPVVIKAEDERVETELEKLGAIVGDNVIIRANSVLNSGTVIGKNTTIHALSNVEGLVAADSIYKN